jgi:hypothetical protein
MRPDNTAPLIATARRRHEITRAKAIQALRDLERDGTPINFATVAHAAGVSRSWLYNENDLREEITRLRETTRRSVIPAIPATQRASDASLRRRLALAEQRIQALRRDNETLRRQLAHALGEKRRADTGLPASP